MGNIVGLLTKKGFLMVIIIIRSNHPDKMMITKRVKINNNSRITQGSKIQDFTQAVLRD